jgi:hypothetical protein
MDNHSAIASSCCLTQWLNLMQIPKRLTNSFKNLSWWTMWELLGRLGCELRRQTSSSCSWQSPGSAAAFKDSDEASFILAFITCSWTRNYGHGPQFCFYFHLVGQRSSTGMCSWSVIKSVHHFSQIKWLLECKANCKQSCTDWRKAWTLESNSSLFPIYSIPKAYSWNSKC